MHIKIKIKQVQSSDKTGTGNKYPPLCSVPLKEHSNSVPFNSDYSVAGRSVAVTLLAECSLSLGLDSRDRERKTFYLDIRTSSLNASPRLLAIEPQAILIFSTLRFIMCTEIVVSMSIPAAF